MKENSEKKKNGIVYKIVILILLCIIGFSLYKVGTILYQYYVGSKQYSEVQEIAGAEEFSGKLNWKALMAKNDDIEAWIYSKDTVINYPVVQGDDNSYYLTHMFNGKWNGAGSIFIDYRCENPFKDFNTIVYGHRMKDGSMFHSLVDYRDKDYYNKHKVMELITKDAQYNVEIFAAVTIPSDSELYKLAFNSDDEKTAYIKDILNKTELETEVNVSASDKLVMMSTCTYEFEDARLVVYGKLIKK